MNTITAGEIAASVGGSISGDREFRINQVLIDSRRLLQPGNTVFFAIRGERNDGHRYIPELFHKGVRCFVSEEAFNMVDYPGATFILVRNSSLALQEFAASLRAKYKGKVVAVTGSNGKTIIKEWIWQCLSPIKRVFRSPMSYNSQVGVPLSLIFMDMDAELAIIEAGISMPGEMQKLEPIILPNIGILSNIGSAHLVNFTGRDQLIDEKLRLFVHASELIYCRDDESLHQAVTSRLPGVKPVHWGIHPEARYRIETIQQGNSTQLHITGKRSVRAEISFTDKASVENACHVLVFLLHSGVPEDSVIHALGRLEPVEMRMEILRGINGCTLINDVYNSDLLSLSNALDYLNEQHRHSGKTLIVSDILQSGRDKAELYRDLAGLVQQKGIEKVIAIGPDLSAHSASFNANTRFFHSTGEFLGQIETMPFRNEAILIKGSRSFHFELISRALQEKTHRTVMQIDLSALISNFRYFKSLLKPGTRLMAMVKALSYGSGGHEIASVLQYHKADYLAVAFTDEGVSLRQNGITLPIMVMNPGINDFTLLAGYNLEPEIYSFDILNELLAYLRKTGQRGFPVHIKLETGMHRLGFRYNDIEQLAGLINASPIRIRSVFSHLAAAEDPQEDDFTLAQIALYKKGVNLTRQLTGQDFLCHILNSSGIERFPEAQFDMVRLGIGLYGIGTVSPEKLTEVSSLRTTITQIHELKEGDTVGYGRRGKVTGIMQIAVIPVGYADGLPRRLGNGVGKFILNRHIAPVFGSICMDMCMIDVTGIPAAVGDTVTVFGPEWSVRKIAEMAGTIPYEILTGVSERVKRVYYQE